MSSAAPQIGFDRFIQLDLAAAALRVRAGVSDIAQLTELIDATHAGAAAKKIATEKGIADAQKDDKCLKCHITGFGVPAEQLDKKFDIKLGVQCESCHGPGEAHMKARMQAAASEDPAKKVLGEGEIIGKPEQKLCVTCHNNESPSYKPFCYHKRVAETRHLNPKKERSEADKKALAKKCGCGDKCPTPECADGKCGIDG